MIFLSVLAASSILLVTFIANGSQYEDAWLYLTGFWIVFLPVWDLLSKKMAATKKKKKNKSN